MPICHDLPPTTSFGRGLKSSRHERQPARCFGELMRCPLEECVHLEVENANMTDVGDEPSSSMLKRVHTSIFKDVFWIVILSCVFLFQLVKINHDRYQTEVAKASTLFWTQVSKSLPTHPPNTTNKLVPVWCPGWPIFSTRLETRRYSWIWSCASIALLS